MKLIFSIDDGDKLDLKVADLFKEYDIPAIFYIPSNCDLSEKDIKKIADMGFELGGHTTSHFPDMKLVSKERLVPEISLNRIWLSSLSGQEVNNFCYPRGKYNEDVINAVKETGFKTARTVDVGNYLTPIDNYRVRTSVHIRPRKEYNELDWLDYAYDILDKAFNDEDGYFHCWSHSWELNRLNEWVNFEKLLKKIKDYDYERADY